MVRFNKFDQFRLCKLTRLGHVTICLIRVSHYALYQRLPAAYYHLYTIDRIRCYLSQSDAVHGFQTSKLDYCNALLCGLPSLLTQKLQRIQNAAARIVTPNRLFHLNCTPHRLSRLAMVHQGTSPSLRYQIFRTPSPISLTNLTS